LKKIGISTDLVNSASRIDSAVTDATGIREWTHLPPEEIAKGGERQGDKRLEGKCRPIYQ
jgi:hypothetical protein